MKSVTYAAGAFALMAGAALAADSDPQWQTAAGAVACRNYFSMAEALASRDDPRWFAETGCARVAGGIPLTVIDPHRGLAAMLVRFHGTAPGTVWINYSGVMGRATVGGNPLYYDDVLRARAKADTDAVMKRLPAIERTEGFSGLMRDLAADPR